MKTIFDKTTRDGLIDRINAVDDSCQALWGKMNVYQMVRHCSAFEEMVLGKQKYKRSFMGRLFGKMALKDFIGDKPIRPNTPTLPQLKISEDSGDTASEKQKWLALVEEYADFSNTNFVHPFFGKMTEEQIGYLVYNHTDHHLRQFGL